VKSWILWNLRKSCELIDTIGVLKTGSAWNRVVVPFDIGCWKFLATQLLPAFRSFFQIGHHLVKLLANIWCHVFDLQWSMYHVCIFEHISYNCMYLLDVLHTAKTVVLLIWTVSIYVINSKPRNRLIWSSANLPANLLNMTRPICYWPTSICHVFLQELTNISTLLTSV